MAFIEPRKTKSGARRYRVWWRLGGTRYGEPQSETFDTLGDARAFKAAVEVAGHQWPDDYVPRVGWVKREPEAEEPAEPVEPVEPVPFGDYALGYVRGLSGVAARTRHDYERDLTNHLLPVFGELDIRDSAAITSALVREWVNGLQAGEPDPDDPSRWQRRPLRPKTIRNVHGLLVAILQAAVETDPPLRASNPAAGVRLPRLDDGAGEDAEEMVVLTREEFAVLRACAKADVRDMLSVFAGTGLRYGELTALQVRDVDLATSPPRLRVRRAWKRQPDSTFALGAPKTQRSRRTVTLSAEITTALQPHLENKEIHEFVFTTPRGGWWRHGAFYGRRWLPALDAAHACGLGKRPRIHDLRHTHVAWLIAGGVALPAIQRRLGHQSITTTIDRYGHLLPEVDRQLLATVDAALANPMLSDDQPAA